jgi:hypothetical protein
VTGSGAPVVRSGPGGVGERVAQEVADDFGVAEWVVAGAVGANRAVGSTTPTAVPSEVSMPRITFPG